MQDYWNHNSAYHPRIVELASRTHGRVLDVGCGDGLLLQRLAPVCTQVVGIDRDQASLELALRRTKEYANVAVRSGDFLAADLGPEPYDLIVSVAVLHHLPLAPALERAAQLLAPAARC
jgi:2-polyprenyl-3-methyl-5-hydroxy-6-metoxy-1,4-benzoquinol methylase